MRSILPLSVSFVVALMACKGDGGGSSGSGSSQSSTSSSSSGGGGGTAANIRDALVCGPDPKVGPGGTALERHEIDTKAFPDALCNDGSAAAIYVRPYKGEENRNKWQINLHGGGLCSDGPSCAARWCSCSSLQLCPHAEETTNFSRGTMITAGPPGKLAEGLLLRGDPQHENPLGDYNQVELQYCSSDGWRGAARDVVLEANNPKTGAPTTFSLHFLGAKILDADIATLRQDGAPALTYTMGGAATPMPDLDEATEIVFTGDSAGGYGLMNNLDHLRDSLRETNVACTGGGSCPLEIFGLIEAAVGPDMSRLDYSTHENPAIRSYDDYVGLASQGMTAIHGRQDESCVAYHQQKSPGSEVVCSDATHVLRHHITTPFFVRMALLDVLVSGNYIEAGLRDPELGAFTPKVFALRLRDELAGFSALSSTAEEGAAFSVEPGVFAPACTKHDTVRSTPDTYETTITPNGAAPITLLEVLVNWRTGGTPTNVLTSSPTGADTVCPK